MRTYVLVLLLPPMRLLLFCLTVGLAGWLAVLFYRSTHLVQFVAASTQWSLPSEQLVPNHGPKSSLFRINWISTPESN